MNTQDELVTMLRYQSYNRVVSTMEVVMGVLACVAVFNLNLLKVLCFFSAVIIILGAERLFSSFFCFERKVGALHPWVDSLASWKKEKGLVRTTNIASDVLVVAGGAILSLSGSLLANHWLNTLAVCVVSSYTIIACISKPIELSRTDSKSKIFVGLVAIFFFFACNLPLFIS